MLNKEIKNIKVPIIMIDHHESPEKFSNFIYQNQKLDQPVKLFIMLLN